MIGPYPAEGNKCGVMIARPVPPGATVIAKPIVPGQHSDPLPLQIPHQIIPEDLKKSNAPKAMVWTTHHPEGQLVMLETFFFFKRIFKSKIAVSFYLCRFLSI